MNLAPILIAILVPSAVTIVSALIQVSNTKNAKKMTEDKFEMYLPKFLFYIGLTLVVMCLGLEIYFIFFSGELTNSISLIIFNIVFNSFVALGLFLMLKVARWRVVVENKKIAIRPAFSKTYTLCFSEIMLAKRQSKMLYDKSSGKRTRQVERIIIRIDARKKFIVESAETGYEYFRNSILKFVDASKLMGFEDILEKNKNKPINTK